MKFVFLFLFLTPISFAPALADNSADKIYEVAESSPEIIIGKRELKTELRFNQLRGRPDNLWYLALERSTLHYQLPSLSATKYSFDPELAGVILGKKIKNKFYVYTGYYELSGEWQRFSRKSTSSNSLTYSQKLDLMQLNLWQNINIGRAFKNKLYFTLGAGLAPVYLTTEQSVLGNSTTELGYLFMFKANMVYLFKNKYEIDFALKMTQGSVGSHEISSSGIVLGINFD